MNNPPPDQTLSNLANRQRVFRARQKLNLPGYVSHITQRAAGREPLFIEDEDYLTMLALIKDAANRFELNCYALCLMENHTHFLLEPLKENLSQAMHSIFFRYAMRFNRKYARRGHIFGGAYRQAVCLDTNYLITASVYIHLNPVRAGLVEQATEYRWSSCNLYCSESPPASFVDPNPVLSHIDSDKALARKYYTTLVLKGRDIQPDNVLEQETAIERFLTRLAAMFPWLFKRSAGKNQTSTHPESEVLDLSVLEEMIQDIQTQKPRSPETVQAKKYLVDQLLTRGFTKTEIAQKMGVSRKTVYNILNPPSQAMP